METVLALPTPTRSDAPPQKKMKIPKVSELIVIQAPKPPLPFRSTDDNIHVWIYKITDDASYLWDEAKSQQKPLWQLQIQQDAQDDSTNTPSQAMDEFVMDCLIQM